MDGIAYIHQEPVDRSMALTAIVFVVMSIVLVAMVAGLAQLGLQPPFAPNDPGALMFMYG